MADNDSEEEDMDADDEIRSRRMTESEMRLAGRIPRVGLVTTTTTTTTTDAPPERGKKRKFIVEDDDDDDEDKKERQSHASRKSTSQHSKKSSSAKSANTFGSLDDSSSDESEPEPKPKKGKKKAAPKPKAKPKPKPKKPKPIVPDEIAEEDFGVPGGMLAMPDVFQSMFDNLQVPVHTEAPPVSYKSIVSGYIRDEENCFGCKYRFGQTRFPGRNPKVDNLWNDFLFNRPDLRPVALVKLVRTNFLKHIYDPQVEAGISTPMDWPVEKILEHIEHHLKDNKMRVEAYIDELHYLRLELTNVSLRRKQDGTIGADDSHIKLMISLTDQIGKLMKLLPEIS
jgi:hypothetical protein